MIAPKTTDAMLRSLNLQKWREENNEVCEEFHINAKIVYKSISLDIIEALVHDAIAYQKVLINEDML